MSGAAGIDVAERELVAAVPAAVRLLETDVRALRTLHGSRPGGHAGRRSVRRARLHRHAERLLDLRTKPIRFGLCRIQRADGVEQLERIEHVSGGELRARARQRDLGFTQHGQWFLDGDGRHRAACAALRWSAARISASSNEHEAPPTPLRVTASTLVVATA